MPACGFHFSAEVVQAFDDGVFIAGWYVDPHDLLLTAEVVDFSLRHVGLETSWTTYTGLAEVNGEVTPVRGFCAWMERKLKGPSVVSPAISVTLKSRSRFVCRAATVPGGARQHRDAVVAAIHLNALDAGALQNAYQPAMAAVARRLAHVLSSAQDRELWAAVERAAARSSFRSMASCGFCARSCSALQPTPRCATIAKSSMCLMIRNSPAMPNSASPVWRGSPTSTCVSSY